MKQKIETLTESQKSKLPEYIEKWTKIGLSTEPANRQKAEEGVRKAYEDAGLSTPRIVWCSSPLTQGLVRAIILSIFKNGLKEIGASVRDSVWDSVWASVWDSVRASVGDSVGASVWDSVWASVEASVGASEWDSVRASVRDSVWDSVEASVGASVRASVWDSVEASGYGQHDANWLGFYDYFSRELNLLEETKKLEAIWLIAENAGWFLPHEKICWISERTSKVLKDVEGRLHCETGMACQYPDGWGVYAWHGVRVQSWIVLEPQKITADLVMKEQNAEIRRVLMERMGLRRYLIESKAEVLDHDDHKVNWKRALLHVGDDVILFVADPSTGRNYPIQVDPSCKTCEQADSWIYQGNKTWDGKPVKQLART